MRKRENGSLAWLRVEVRSHFDLFHVVRESKVAKSDGHLFRCLLALEMRPRSQMDPNGPSQDDSFQVKQRLSYPQTDIFSPEKSGSSHGGLDYR